MLSSDQTQRFETDGFLSRINVAEPIEAERYRLLFDGLEATEGHEKAQIGLLDRHFNQPFIIEIATRPNVLDYVEALIGPNILLLATHFFCKYGSDTVGADTKFVAWHQDVTYWGLEPPKAITVWYAIDGSDIENGCMRVIPGSHEAGIREHGKADTAGNLLSINQEVSVTEAEAAGAIDLELIAGQASIHDGMTIHCSLPNRTNRRRCGLTLRYVPTFVKPAAANSMGKNWKTMLVRGVDEYNHFGQSPA